MNAETDQKLRLELFAILTSMLFILSTAFVASQNSYKDLEGRFSFVPPDGWTLKSEQMGTYNFGNPEGTAILSVTYMGEMTSVDDIISIYLKQVLKLDGGTLPPKGSVVDMTLNGTSARWIAYPFKMKTQGVTIQLHVNIGAVIDEQKRVMGFFAILNDKTLERYGKDVKRSFETLQLHDLPLSGIENLKEIDVDYTSLKEKSLSPASTFTHDLFTIDLPAGWKYETGIQGLLVKLTKETDMALTISVMGNKKDLFGATASKIMLDMNDGLMNNMPSMKMTKDLYTLTTSKGETVSVQEYEGIAVASGQNIKLGVILAAAKNNKRGLGFMAVYNIPIRDEAVRDTEAILKSLR